MLKEKLKSFFKKMGKVIKNTREGSVSQKILTDNWLIFDTSPVSWKIQIIAIKDIVGIEANKDPKKVFILDISEIRTIIDAEIITLAK